MSNPHDPADPETQTIDMAISLTLTLADCEMVGEMQAAGRFTTVDDLIENALFHYAKHLGVNAPADFMMFRRRLNKIGRTWASQQAEQAAKRR